MKLIIPMAGLGKRMRPHTFTTPKPLISIAGKPIVEWLIEEVTKIYDKKFEEIAFIIGDFGIEVEKILLSLASKFNIKGRIYYQKKALGTAHAVYCAEASLEDEIIIAFADTIFFANFNLNTASDSIVWVKQVENPSQFGVVNTNINNLITDFVEKPKDPISNLAIIGIYYFKNGLILRENLKYLIKNNIQGNEEFQLTDTLEIMRKEGILFSPAIVDEWLDCGNKEAILFANKRILTRINADSKRQYRNSKIINPCYINEDAEICNSIIGPYVSINKNVNISNCIINNSIVYSNSKISNISITNSIIGNQVTIIKNPEIFNLGDYSQIS